MCLGEPFRHLADSRGLHVSHILACDLCKACPGSQQCTISFYKQCVRDETFSQTSFTHRNGACFRSHV